MRRLQISEYTSWNEVARWALPLFAPEAAPPAQLNPLLERLRAVPDAEERASQALHWVQNRIRYWSMGADACNLRPRPPALVVDSGYGDCKDKALLLATMLHSLFDYDVCRWE